MDKFYNSPALAPRLKSLKTDCVGTLRLSRKEFPHTKSSRQAKERRNGSSTFRPGVRSEVERHIYQHLIITTHYYIVFYLLIIHNFS